MKVNDTFNIGELHVTQGSVLFPEYEIIKAQALDLSSSMEQVEVTNENIKISKQLLASVNKQLRKLSDERIKVKKTLLEPYDDLDSKVKEITTIVKKADNMVREQVREIEEREREEKREMIESMFNRRMKRYDFSGLLGFKDFIKPSQLNKTVSINKIEIEMVEWLTKVEQDLKVIYDMEHSFEIISDYQKTQNVAQSINSVRERHKVIQEMERKVEQEREIVSQPTQTKTKKPTIIIELCDAKDARLVEMFMKQEKIEYCKTVK